MPPISIFASSSKRNFYYNISKNNQKVTIVLITYTIIINKTKEKLTPDARNSSVSFEKY